MINLIKKFIYRTSVTLAYKSCAIIIRVHTVGRIMQGLGLSSHSLLKELVERYVSICILVSQSSDDWEYGSKLCLHARLIRSVKDVGSENDDFGICLCLEILEDLAVVQLYLLVRGGYIMPAATVPDVIDTDEYGNNVGLKRNCVRIESVEKLTGSVTADAEIDEFKIDFRIALLEQLCGILGITGCNSFSILA